MIADNDLILYKTFLETKRKKIPTFTDGLKCVYIYKKSVSTSEDYSNVIILNQKMLFMTICFVNSKYNPHQKIIFVSSHLEKILLEVLIKLNRAIIVIEKLFLLNVLDHMINSKRSI